MDRSSIEFSVRRGKFLDFQELVLAHICKVLARVSCRPPNLYVHNSGGFPQTNVLFQRRSSEGSSAANSTKDRARTFAFVLHNHFDSGANRATIALGADQLQVDPIVAISWILE